MNGGALPHGAGVLLHPTSLPDAARSGALGAGADAAIAFLAAAGMCVWQMLPVGPVHADRSPYAPLSLDAGGEHLICLRRLREEPWMRCGRVQARPAARAQALAQAARLFERHAASAHAAFERFVHTHAEWLQPYCAFRVLRRRFRGAPWTDWPARWRDGAGEAPARLDAAAPASMQRERIVQYLFARQWQAMRERARAAGIALYGDLPFYPAADSADTWSQRDLFDLDARGRPRRVGGVPPDAFCAAGQRWDAPVYRWERAAEDGYRWWRARIVRLAERFDLVRLDHFRGYAAYWSVPAGAGPADGEWRPGPGAALLRALCERPERPLLVAEDLGAITPDVDALRERFGLPGMRVLQFGTAGGPRDPHRPANHPTHAVACTGTHDTDTLRGWWSALAPAQRERAAEALGVDAAACPAALADAVLASRARLAVLPAQDILDLGSDARMNAPGTAGGNWTWRIRRDALDGPLAQRWRARLLRCGRCAAGP